MTRYNCGIPERVEANTTCPVPPPRDVATGMGVLSGVGVTAMVGDLVCVGAKIVAVPEGAIKGVTVGNCRAVGVAARSGGAGFNPQFDGSFISRIGAKRLVIPGGTNSGLKRTNATRASETRKIVPKRIGISLRFLRFLRLGLKTGSSPAEETPFGFTDL